MRASIVGWMVTDAKGNRAMFFDKPKADEYAVKVHGTVEPLYTIK